MQNGRSALRDEISTGRLPRIVYFFQKCGRLLMKKLRAVYDDPIFARQKDCSVRLLSTQVAGEVELFS